MSRVRSSFLDPGSVATCLEEEVTALVGRTRYQRRSAVDGTPGFRNGHGKPRQWSLRKLTDCLVRRQMIPEVSAVTIGVLKLDRRLARK